MKRSMLALGTAFLAGCQVNQASRMSGPALDAAATSLTTLQARMEICACNIANAQTVGFKATRVVLEDLPYYDRAVPSDDGGSILAHVGSGVRIARTLTDMSQGPAVQTGRPWDVMINGRGFLILRSGGTESGQVYTRAGVLSVNADGELVMAMGTGRQDAVEPGIVILSNATQVTIDVNGRVSVLTPGNAEPVEIGQLQIAMFASAEGLKPLGGNVFAETADSGAPQVGEPGTDGRGQILQGMYEGSNVNPIIEQIEASRINSLYEAISRMTFPPDPSASRLTAAAR